MLGVFSTNLCTHSCSMRIGVCWWLNAGSVLYESVHTQLQHAYRCVLVAECWECIGACVCVCMRMHVCVYMYAMCMCVYVHICVCMYICDRLGKHAVARWLA